MATAEAHLARTQNLTVIVDLSLLLSYTAPAY